MLASIFIFRKKLYLSHNKLVFGGFELSPAIKLGAKFTRDNVKEGSYPKDFLASDCPYCFPIARMATEPLALLEPKPHGSCSSRK